MNTKASSSLDPQASEDVDESLPQPKRAPSGRASPHGVIAPDPVRRAALRSCVLFRVCPLPGRARLLLPVLPPSVKFTATHGHSPACALYIPTWSAAGGRGALHTTFFATRFALIFLLFLLCVVDSLRVVPPSLLRLRFAYSVVFSAAEATPPRPPRLFSQCGAASGGNAAGKHFLV